MLELSTLEPTPDRSGSRTFLIVSPTNTFPNGGGATSRLVAWATGLSKCGVSVRVVCLRPGPPEFVKDLPGDEGQFGGISYRYVVGRFDTKGGIHALIQEARATARLVGEIARLRKGGPQPVVYYYSPEQIHFALAAWLTSKVRGAKFLGERTEYPFTGSNKARRYTLKNRLREALVYKTFDGYIGISTALERYVTARKGRRSWVLRVPALIDQSAILPFAPTSVKVVCYCGYIGSEESIASMEAFSAALPPGDEGWRLLLIGQIQKREALDAAIERLGLQGRVDAVGAVSRQDMPRMMASASIHVLPRKEGEFSRYGFPTKLGEYMASGRTVVVTDTGDIAMYVKDGVNGFLVPPDNPAAFAEKLRLAMSDEGLRNAVGARGRETAVEEFGNENWAKRLAAKIWG